MKLTIKTVNGDRVIDANRVGRNGTWAVHHTLKGSIFSHRWTVTHIPTGIAAISDAKTKQLAAAIAKAFSEIQSSDPAVVRSAFGAHEDMSYSLLWWGRCVANITGFSLKYSGDVNWRKEFEFLVIEQGFGETR